MKDWIRQSIFSLFPSILAIILTSMTLMLPHVSAFVALLFWFLVFMKIFDQYPPKPIQWFILLGIAFAALLWLYINNTLFPRSFFLKDPVASFYVFPLDSARNTLIRQFNELFVLFKFRDSLTALVTILLLLVLSTWFFIKRFLINTATNGAFEFRAMLLGGIQEDASAYLRRCLLRMFIIIPLWGAAMWLLSFPHPSQLTLFAGFMAALPVWGLFIGALVTILFIQAELFLFQLGGVLILVSVLWFILYILNLQPPLPPRHIFAAILTMALAFFMFRFNGLILATPMLIISALFMDCIKKYAALLQKSVFRPAAELDSFSTNS